MEKKNVKFLALMEKNTMKAERELIEFRYMVIKFMSENNNRR